MKYSKKQLKQIASDYSYAVSGDEERLTSRLLDPDYTNILLPKYLKGIKDWENKNNQKINVGVGVKYEKGGEVSESGRYLNIVSDNNKMIITLTEEGNEEVVSLREDGKSDSEIMYELFEDIGANSDLIYHYDLGESGLGLTSASGVTGGYFYSDNGEYEESDDAKLYYFNDYALRSEVDDLLSGELVLTSAKNEYKKGGSIGYSYDNLPKVGDKVSLSTKKGGIKSGTKGTIYEVTPSGESFKLMDDYGNKESKWFYMRDFSKAKVVRGMANGGNVNEEKWQLKSEKGYYSRGLSDGNVKWYESPDMGYSFNKQEADDFRGRLEKETGLKIDVVEYNKDWWKVEKYAKGSTVRANNSPLLRYATFEDNWHINLLKLKPNRNQDGLKYKNENNYAVSRQSNKGKQEVFEFKTLYKAESKFNKLVELGKTYSPLAKEGKTENYAKGGSVDEMIDNLDEEMLGIKTKKGYSKGGDLKNEKSLKHESKYSKGGKIKEWVAVFQKDNSRKIVSASGKTKDEATRDAETSRVNSGISKDYDLIDIHQYEHLEYADGGDLNDFDYSMEEIEYYEQNPQIKSPEFKAGAKLNPPQHSKISYKDVSLGDSGFVKSENKMGIVVNKSKGGEEFTLTFVDGTKKAYKKSELEFYDFNKHRFNAGGGVEPKVSVDHIVEGARFKTKTGIVFIIDKVGKYDDKYKWTPVETSLDGGKKGNYRDDINDVVAFLNEGKAVKIAETGAVLGDYTRLFHEKIKKGESKDFDDFSHNLKGMGYNTQKMWEDIWKTNSVGSLETYHKDYKPVVENKTENKKSDWHYTIGGF